MSSGGTIMHTSGPNRQNLALLKKIAFASSNNQITMSQMVNLFVSQHRGLASDPTMYLCVVFCYQNKYLSRVNKGVYELTPKAHKVLQCN